MRVRRQRRMHLLLAAALVGCAAAATPAHADHGTAPPVTSREVVGVTVQGRPIIAVHRAHEGATKRLLVIGNMHGDERAGLRVVRRLLDREHFPREVDLWLIRTVNPDGTVAGWRTNAHGVDLNRNFPHRWRSSERGSTWSGTEPLSEPESRALRDFVRRLDPWLTVVFHQPLFGVGSTDKRMATVRALAEGIRLPVRDFVCTGICRGTFTGWLNSRTDGLGVTVEFGHSVPTWRIGRAATTVLRVGAGLTDPAP